MKRLLFMTFLLLAVMVCSSSLGWAGAAEDIKAGYEKRLSGNYNEAIRLYTKAIASGELSGRHLSDVYVNRGDVWEIKGDYDKAIADYTKAIELNPMSNVPTRCRGGIWEKKGDYDMAIIDYTTAIALSIGRDFESYRGRGLAWEKKGEYDEAIADYTQAIKLHPKYDDAYYNRGYAWEKKGEYDRAIADYTKGIELFPNKPGAAKAKEAIYKLENKTGQADSAIAQAGAAIPLRDASSREALSNAIRQGSYSSPDSIARRLVEFNVLCYAFVDPKTGEITLIGIYDPAYASGPIPYYDLLADALQNPYPKFSLEYDPSDPAVRRIQQTIDNEMSRVTRDVNYGAAWMKRLMTAAFDPRSQAEDRLVLEQRLRKLGIPPDVFTAYMAWDGESGLYNAEFRQKMGLFTAKLLAGVGIDERVGYGIIALKDFENAVKDKYYGRAPADGEQLMDKTMRLFTYLGIESDFHRLRQEMAAGRLQGPRATTELLACVYGGFLRGLQVPESEVNSLIERYRAGRIPEQVLTDKKNARYAELGARSLSRNLLNGFRFSGKHLSRIYSLPPVMSGAKLFGSPPDSPIMRVFFDGDYTLKYITSAAADSKSVPGAMSFDAYLGVAADRAGASAGKLPIQGVNRYWIFPGTVQMDGLPDGGGVRFVSANVRIGAEPLEELKGSDSRGTDFYRRTLNQYGEHLTSQYDAYARMYPSFHIIRETEKVIALARWIKSRRAPVHVHEMKPANPPVPQRVEGFWGLTYSVRPTGMTDSIYLWIVGGVAFSQQEGDDWIRVTPSVTAASDVLHQLAASTALAEKAAAAAVSGDLDAARELAEKSAQAMTGQIDRSKFPEAVAVPVSHSGAEIPNAAKQAQLSQAAIAAVEQNVSAMMKAKQDLSKAEALRQTNPQEYARIQQQSQQLQSRSEANLSRLQSLLQKYRGQTATADEVTVDLRNLDPNKPIVVASPPPTTKPTSGEPNWTPCSDSAVRDVTMTPERQSFLNHQLREARGRLKYINTALKNLMAINVSQQVEIEKVTKDISAAYNESVDRAWSVVFDLLTSLPANKFIDNYTVAKSKLGDAMKYRTGLLTTPLDAAAKKEIQSEILRIQMAEGRLDDIYQRSMRLLGVYKDARLTYGFQKWTLQEQDDYAKIKDGMVLLGKIILEPKLEKYLNTKAFFAGEKYFQVAAMGRMAYYGTGFFLDILAQKIAWEPLTANLQNNLNYNTQAMEYLRQKAAKTYQEIGCINAVLEGTIGVRD